MKSWEKDTILNDNGEHVEAIFPEIISASRSTDIPSFYSKWFFNRLQKGHLAWINPFNRQLQYIGFKNARLIVFWTKDAKPILKYLPVLDEKKIGYYFQYTLNDYENEGLEPSVPPLEKRIINFQELSRQIGKEKVIWRFDPLILAENISTESLLQKMKVIGDELKGYTEKLVISFADIKAYRKVQSNLKETSAREFSIEEVEMIVKELQILNNDWGYEIATCAEEYNLGRFGIKHNRCVDDELIVRLYKKDKKLMDFLGYEAAEQISLFSETEYQPNPKLKDKGQRAICGCIVSKDVGMYNTCNHLCIYCYANSSENLVKKNLSQHDPESETIINLQNL
jgi:DNA repair photolyase